MRQMFFAFSLLALLMAAPVVHAAGEAPPQSSNENCADSVLQARMEGARRASERAAAAATERMQQTWQTILRDRLNECTLGQFNRRWGDLRQSGQSVWESITSGGIFSALGNALAQKITESVVNQVCNVSTQAMNALDNRIKNLVCIPTFGLPNPFDFNANFENLACNGWSVLGNPGGSPIQGSGAPILIPAPYQGRFGGSSSSGGGSSSGSGATPTVGSPANIGGP